MATTTFTQKLADHICERLANKQSLTSICDEEGMPSAGTVAYWRKKHPEFDAQYMAAREMQAEALFEEIVDIVDDGRNDWVERETRNGSYIALNSEAVQRSKLRAETRFKLIERMNPARFGAKVQLDHTSSDGTMTPQNMTDEQKAAKIAAIMQRAAAKKAAGQKPMADDGSDLV